MPGGLGPRFALEAAFLIVLAAVAAYARLDAAEIIVVMAGGWLLAAVFEVLAARRERLYPGATWERRRQTDEPHTAESEESDDAGVSWSSRPPEATPEVREEVAVSAAAPEPPSPPKVDEEATGEIPLPKRRRWFRRGLEDEPAAAEEVAARPSARHVRLIRENTPGDVEQRKDAEAGS
jgi:hypothetical protein